MAESKGSNKSTKTGDKVKKIIKKKNATETTKQNEEHEDGSSVSSESAQEEAEEHENSKQIVKSVANTSVTISREEYLQAHRDLTYDKNQLQIKNNILHRRLAEYYKKRKLVHVLKQLDHSMDLEEKYQQKLMSYEELKNKAETEMTDIKSKVYTVELQYINRLEQAESKFDTLQTLERNTGSGLIYSKKGKPIADKTVERFLTLQRRKQEQCTNLCLRYIRARNAVADLDAVVKKLEKLGPGLYVNQYEQLYIDNQNFMTKIEEREDELIKNRTKCTEHNQILAHIREKMNHTDEVIDEAECDLGDAEMEFLRAREELGYVKGHRDKLRCSLESERLKAGLLTRKDLLRDFQDATDELVKLREQKERLEAQIARGIQQLRDARNIIQQQKNPNQASPK